MKSLRLLFLCIVFTLPFYLYAQSKDKSDTITFRSDVVPPKLENFNKFRNHLPIKDLKRIYDTLANEQAFATYLYSFKVSNTGKASTLHVYLKNNRLFDPIMKYILNIFNMYSWIPGYEKNCRLCKKSTFMQLGFYWQPEQNNILVKIDRIYFHGKDGCYKFYLPINEKH